MIYGLKMQNGYGDQEMAEKMMTTTTTKTEVEARTADQEMEGEMKAGLLEMELFYLDHIRSLRYSDDTECPTVST